MFASHRSTRLVAGLLVSAAALFGSIAPHAHAASRGEKVQERAPATVTGMRTVTDPTGVYQISYPSGWTMSKDKSNLLFFSKDGNVAVTGMDWTGSATNSPLATNLPTLPGVLKIGTASGKARLDKATINGQAVQYGTINFTRSGGSKGAVFAVRAYEKGHVFYLIAAIKDVSASTANNDINQLAKVVYTTRFL
jgi:hypothetical protein